MRTKEEKLAVARSWKKRNAEQVRAYRKGYWKDNKLKEIENNKRWFQENPQSKSKHDKTYRAKNLDKIKEFRSTQEYKDKKNALAKERYHRDLRYNIEKRLRASFVQALRLGLAIKSKSLIKLIGCSIEQLKIHLESLFTEDMSWNRFSEIHIDHKIPCASFDLTDPQQQEACFHYTNLQPLWAKDNLSKGARISL